MITSLSNAKVKFVRSLARRRARYAARQFVIEGVKSIEEAIGAGIVPALAFFTAAPETEPRAHALLDRLRATASPVLEVSDAVMQAMSNTETPSGILAVVPFVELPLPASPGFVLILDSVRDPGNVGTILRSAWAAGVDAVLLAAGTADPYNDKVIRSAMGAHFHVPLRVESWQAIEDMVRPIPRIYLADARGETVYTRADWSRPVALIVGGEAEGASDAARKLATERVSVPMRGGAESLNAAMAATVLLFEAAGE
jgi:TrmH family RNA methyltransferase